MIYTGDRQSKPDKISLRRNFFGDQDCCVDVEAKVIYDSKQGDILNQFITFSKVFDAQRKLYPDDRRKAVQETIRICREKDVLTAYLEQEEAAAVMFTFADQEREFSRALRKEREAGEARGEIKGAIRLYNDEMKLTIPEIVQKVMNRFSLTKEAAEQYVENTLNLQKS